jgi:hypothetical protein
MSAIVSMRTRLTSRGARQSWSLTPAPRRAIGTPSLAAASAQPSAASEEPETTSTDGSRSVSWPSLQVSALAVRTVPEPVPAPAGRRRCAATS